MENGVVIQLNPRGVIFVPREMTDLDIEVIYSYALHGLSINALKFPKIPKKIYSCTFTESSLKLVKFEEGAELDFIGGHAFYLSEIMNLKLPPIIWELESLYLMFRSDVIELPSKLNFGSKNLCSKDLVPSLITFFFGLFRVL